VFGDPHTDVLVVGAGPTGLLAALRLAERGVAVEVIEEEWRPAGHSYALALHPSSLELLDELGLAAEAIAQGRRLESLTLLEAGEVRTSLPIGEAGARFPFVLALPQNVLEGLLGQRLADRGVRVHWSHRLAGIEPREDGVRATVQRLEKESTGYAVAHTEWTVARELSFQTAFLVGADGHRSLVRRALEVSFEECRPSQVFAVVECSGGPATVGEIRLVLEPETINALWPLPGERARWSLELEAPEVRSDDRFKSRLTTMLGERFFPHLDEARTIGLLQDRAPWFEPERWQLGWSAEVRFERRLASSFGRDRVWLAGDAAHLTGPAGMQSMNAGLREAGDLSTRIATIQKGEAGIELLEAYGREHRAEWEFLLGRAGGLRVGKQTPPFAAANAERLLPCLPATGHDLRSLADRLGLQVDPG
jgi:2-polyprenyl-6-methoxyphenol hydroxylase-like FAD-dependent oxidoreductase